MKGKGNNMRFIGDFREGDMVSETYLCKRKEMLKTKAGKSYCSMILQDKTGTVDSKVWELSNAIEHFEVLDYIHVEAQVTCFQNTLQLNVKRIRKSSEGEFVPSDYLPVSEYNIDEMYGELLKFVASLQDKHLKRLAELLFVEDKEFAKRFKGHSAAKSVHHGFIGGLVEHTLGVTKLAEFMANNYSVLNRDLLVCAAMFHDIGKVDELSPFPENDYTDEGQLMGHIFMGAAKVGELVKLVPGFPKKLANEVVHCILAHHGELEYGSPKKPALVEAVALTYADNTDAKLQTMKEIFANSEEKADWLGYNKFFETNIRRTTGV